MNARIEINPLVCHGNPVIKNTRVLVANILAEMANGQTNAQIIENYPNITPKDFSAVLDFSSEFMRFEAIPYESAGE